MSSSSLNQRNGHSFPNILLANPVLRGPQSPRSNSQRSSLQLTMLGLKETKTLEASAATDGLDPPWTPLTGTTNPSEADSNSSGDELAFGTNHNALRRWNQQHLVKPQRVITGAARESRRNGQDRAVADVRGTASSRNDGVVPRAPGPNQQSLSRTRSRSSMTSAEHLATPAPSAKPRSSVHRTLIGVVITKKPLRGPQKPATSAAATWPACGHKGWDRTAGMSWENGKMVVEWPKISMRDSLNTSAVTQEVDVIINDASIFGPPGRLLAVSDVLGDAADTPRPVRLLSRGPSSLQRFSPSPSVAVSLPTPQELLFPRTRRGPRAFSLGIPPTSTPSLRMPKSNTVQANDNDVDVAMENGKDGAEAAEDITAATQEPKIGTPLAETLSFAFSQNGGPIPQPRVVGQSVEPSFTTSNTTRSNTPSSTLSTPTPRLGLGELPARHRPLHARIAKASAAATGGSRSYRRTRVVAKCLDGVGAEIAELGFDRGGVGVGEEILRENIKFLNRSKRGNAGAVGAGDVGQAEGQEGGRMGGQSGSVAIPTKTRTETYVDTLEDIFGSGSVHRGAGPKPKNSEYKLKKPSSSASRSANSSGSGGSIATPEIRGCGSRDGHRVADKRSREESDTSDDVEDEKRQKRIRNDMVDERMAKEWVTALKQLIKGKTTIGREGLENLSEIIELIEEAKENIVSTWGVMESMVLLSELDEIPQGDEYSLRRRAAGLVEYWKQELCHVRQGLHVPLD